MERAFWNVKTKNSGLKASTFLLNAFWRALFVLNIFLSAVAAAAALLLFLFLFVGKIPAPQFVCDLAERQIRKAGLSCSFSAIFFSFPDTVEIVRPSVRLGGSTFPVFSADKVEVGVFGLSLFSGDPQVKFVSVQNGRLSDSMGDILHSPKIRDIAFSASSEGPWWIVRFLSFKAGNLTVSARGTLNEGFDPKNMLSEMFGSGGVGGVSGRKPSGSPADSFVGAFDSALEKAVEFAGYFDGFKEPSLALDFVFFEGDSGRVRADLNSPKCSYKFGEINVDAQDISAAVSFSSGSGKGRRMRLDFSALRLQSEGLPSCENVSFSADAFAEYGALWLENAELFAGKIAWRGFFVDNVTLRKDALSAEDYSRGWNVFAAFDNNRLGGVFSFAPGGRVRADFNARINPRGILNLEEFSDIPELAQLDFPDGISADGSVYFEMPKRELSVRASLESENCVVMNIPVERLSGSLEFDGARGVMDADKLYVKTREGWTVRGQMLQNFGNKDYKIRVFGSIRPMAIAHFMEPWWGRIMKSFAFAGDGNFPRADVSVEGRWGSPQKIWCSGEVSGRNAVYNGSQFDSFGLRVWVNPSRITLYDVSLSSADRNAHGFIEWLYGKDGITRFERQRLFLESNLNSTELISLGGDDAREILDVVRFHNAPRLTLNAELSNPSLGGGGDEFNAEVFAAGRTQIEFASLENLRFRARSNKIDTNIDDAMFDFCGGQAEASINLRKVDGGMLFGGRAKASDMVQSEFFEFLDDLDSSPDTPSLSALSPERAAESGQGAPARREADARGLAEAAPGEGGAPPSISPQVSGTAARGAAPADSAPPDADGLMGENGKFGRVNIDISLSGDSRDFNNVSGSGFVVLSNRDLLELNVFGFLSRALSALKLPFGSFDITQFYGPFKIGEGNVSFPRLSMEGPVMRIRGFASYDFLEDNLQANLTAIPFAGISTPIISSIVKVINPLTSVATIKLRGKLSDPEMGVSINPMNIFDREKKDR